MFIFNLTINLVFFVLIQTVKCSGENQNLITLLSLNFAKNLEPYFANIELENLTTAQVRF